MSQRPTNPSDRHADGSADARAKAERRRHRVVVVVPRLRAIGSLWLLLTVLAHNWLFLDHVNGSAIATFGALQLGYLLLSKWSLTRYYRPDASPELGDVFLVSDVILFVLAIYVSGGDKSWLLPLLCVRVADQLATSPRRAFAFATWTAFLHALLVLYMGLVEQRSFRFDAELAKVLFVYVLNCYLSLAAGPSERQRKEAVRATSLAQQLIEQLGQRTAQLEIERSRAAEASQAKSTFLANISHEIRTPMNAVLGMADLLLEEPLSPAQHKMAETIFDSCRSLLAIVNDVLDMSKVEAGELRLAANDLDLSQLVESVLTPMRVLAESKGLSLSAELEGLSERAVCGDEMRLRQVLFNLVGNAIKFTHAGSVTLRVVQSARDAELVAVRFSVEDTGIGMTEEASQRVFEPFKQADESTTRRFGGTGLGLSISKRLVEMMGGAFTVRTALGRGSNFAFEVGLPLGDLRTKLGTRRVESQRAEQLRALRPRVLIAEDTEVNRVLLQKWLERLGCEVMSVGDGSQALTELTRDHTFAAVFMDWHMPVIDGLKATEQVRQWERDHGRPRTPIIGFTASAFVDEIERCRLAGMDDVLSKPIVRSELEHKLSQHLLGAQRATAANSGAVADSEPSIDADLIQELLDFGAAEFLHSLLGTFLAELPERLRDLAEAVASRDGPRVKQLAHALRGGAGSVGARRLSALAASLEFQAAAEPTGDLASALTAVRAELSRVTAELATIRSRTASTPPALRSG